MKNIIKYIALPSLAIIVFLLVAVNYGQRLRFGDAYFENDTANKILTNKSLYFESGDSVYYNGVVVTSGSSSGIAASDNITFTGRDSTTDLWRFGDSVRFYDHVLFKDTLKVSNAIAIFDSAKISVDVSMLSDSSGINWTSGGLSQIYQLPSPASILAFKQNEFDFFTKKGNQILYLDSLNGMTLNYGVYTGSGSGLTSVDAITLKGQDTSKFARTDTLITEDIKGKWNFWNVVRCIGVVTFDVSPIFNSLVNFANGITTTTITASSTATFNGDMLNTGWKSQGSSQNQYKYSRDTVLKMVLNTTSGTAFTDTIRHGITNWRSIVFTQFIVHEDSANVNCIIGLYANDAASASLYGAQAWTDSLFARVRLPGGNGNSTAWRGDTCTVYIKYTDYNR